jgi:P4 family phage/plasmid primase-like protien
LVRKQNRKTARTEDLEVPNLTQPATASTNLHYSRDPWSTGIKYDLSKPLFPDSAEQIPSPQIGVNFIKGVFSSTTEMPVHLCSLGNERDGKHATRTLNTRNPDEVSAFIDRWDMAERGLFYCVSTMKVGSHKRNKDNATELPLLFADIDLKDVAEDVDEIIRKLKLLKYAPSLIVRSGNGVHALWLLTEAIDVQLERDRAESLLRQLADLVGGDLQVCEVARLLRLPGSHNTKLGAFKEVVVEASPNVPRTYDLGDLEEWLGETSPIILRKVRERAVTAGQAVETDPYLAYAKELKTPIDIKARLDAMMFMGGGDAAVHKTQTDVASSMVAKGHDDEEIVELLMAATRAAAGDYGPRWNWRKEEREIRKDIAGWRVKLAKKGETPKPRPVPAAAETVNKEVSNPAPAVNSNVVSMAKARTALAIKPKLDASPDDANHIKIGVTVIDLIKKRGDDLIFTEQAAWFCEGGLWRMMTDSSAWLNVEIEKAIVGLNYSSTLKLRNETKGWIQCRPELWRNEVKWDKHGMVPTRSGLVDPRTGDLTTMLPEHYCTWRIETEYDKDAKCPWWLQMLEDVFADRQPQDREATIRVIQELLGAGLIDVKSKDLSKALIFLGGSNFGKSGLLEVLGGLFGQDQNTSPIEALEGPHGMMPFVNRRPWILHEAFDQRKWHFSSSVKALVTGEPINVNIKNGPMLSIRMQSPIFWGTNHPPQFKEATKAIVNRLVVIECRREFIDGELVGAAVEARKQGLDKPSSLVLATEMPGLLAWALVGLRRALERGRLVLTHTMMQALGAIRRDTNLVAGFLEQCCTYDSFKRISAPDFALAFSAWWLAEKGENRQTPSNESISKALKAMADPLIAMGDDLRDGKRRYYGGLILNEEGLNYHQAGYEARDLEGKTVNATAPADIVNSNMPPSWGDKPAISAIRIRTVTGDVNPT